MDLITIVIWMLVGAVIAWAIEWFFWDRPTRAAMTRQFEQDLTASRNETEKLRVELRDSRDRSAQLEREVGDVRAVLKAEADVRATAESKLLASDKKSVDLTAELARTRSELQTATTRAAIIPTLEQSANEWEQKHRAETEARAAADEKGLALSAELEAVRAELAQATQQAALVPNLQSSALDWEARYRQELSNREQAEAKSGEVHLLLDRSRAQIVDWETRYKAEANARAAAEGRAGSLSLELDQLRGQIDALLKQQQDAFTAADQQAGGLSTEIDKLRAQLEAQLSQFEAETAARRQAEAELESTRGELTTVHERVAVIPTLQASATDWESKYTAEIANRTRYQQEIQNYETELAQRGDRLNALDAQHRQTLSAQAAAEQRSAELAAQLEDLRRQLTEGQASAESIQKARAELEQERDALRTQIGALEEKVSSEATARASIEQRLIALEQERDGLRAQTEASESRLSSEATARTAADQQADTLRSELDKLRLEIGGLHNRVTLIPTLENNVSSWEQRYQSEVQLRNQLDGAVRERESEIVALREKIATLEAEQSTRQSQLELFGTPTRADNLEDINGIGKVFARKLNAAGVMSFEDLARMPVEKIREIIQPKAWQKIEPEAWVVEAATLAGRAVQAPVAPTRVDNLEDINGIGVVFAARLNAAGIVNFEQLAATSPERIRDILNPEEWQKIEPEAWISEAAEFARRGQ